eukprot:16436192-Heterocapsa_arctica.AAC.1
MENWGWKVALLTDVKWGVSEVREYRTLIQKWTIVAHGKVAIAMDEDTTHLWRTGGARWEGGSGGVGAARSVAIDLPERGWRKGYTL